MPLSHDQLQFYQRNGYVVVENVVPADVLQRLREAISEMTDAAQAGRVTRMSSVLVEPDAADTAVVKAPLRKLNELVPHDDYFRSVAASDTILDSVAQLTGGAQHITLYSDQVFLKPAFCGSEKPLHQDNSYFRVTPHEQGVTCWMAIDDSTEENGCMRYIRGSHKLGLVPHKQLTPAHLTPEAGEFGEETAVPIPAGAAIFHHLLVLHSSRANSSPNPRRAWALHYVNADAQCPVRPPEKMIRLR
jgi:ectoine hydroxylase-related dioxygenase (phytanoyl-CoA dioxygenase family)